MVWHGACKIFYHKNDVARVVVLEVKKAFVCRSFSQDRACFSLPFGH